MTTHDELAYAVALYAVNQIRKADGQWSKLFSTDARVTSSRAWPVPDFVLQDDGNKLSIAAEFKPPGQSKREYLTGLGQAIAYTRDFDYGLLVVPSIADDGYRISDHICGILNLPELRLAPVGMITYDPSKIAPSDSAATLTKFFGLRKEQPSHKASVADSFYAKWREISPEEISTYLKYLYDEKLNAAPAEGSIRDRAFARLWDDIQKGALHHWGGGIRHAAQSTKEGVRKNYRNFINHIGWMETDGTLTADGLAALHAAHLYGSWSRIFQNHIARSLLLSGKHLILINAINQFQDRFLSQSGPFPDEPRWLAAIEATLEERGLLKRNPGRHEAAERMSGRQFLKAEKQIWKQLELIVPRTAARVYHQGRGFVFDWARITELVRQ